MRMWFKAFLISIILLSFSFSKTYTIRLGDTLYNISKSLEISLDDLKTLNSNLKVLNVGDTLKLPPYQYHLYKKSDTLEKLAKTYNTTVDDIVKLNEGKELKRGDVIRVLKKIEKKEDVKENKTTQIKESQAVSVDVSPEQEITNMIAVKQRLELFNLIKSRHFVFPSTGKIVDFYGLSENIMHYGINIELKNEEVFACEKGKVVFVGSMRGVGKVILIDHGSGLFSMYNGNLTEEVKKGDEVNRRDKIASAKKELFFSVYTEGVPLNPLAVLLK